MKSVAVYCASSFGPEAYTKVAQEVGRFLARNKIRVVYGGGSGGLMGTVANSALEAGGEVVGVIPDFLGNLEIRHKSLTEIFVVETMHERKAKMVALSDGILVLPGGYGTLDELFEILAWSQLRIFAGPVGILNVNGFYDLLLAHLDRAVEDKFLRPENRALVLVDDNMEGLLGQMGNFVHR